ncbi:MAG TPA: glutaredoxin family protein [Moraxellaceae bacterium]|nr:glutaredoxin family protein [Moraxellaceae bacterium]
MKLIQGLMAVVLAAVALPATAEIYQWKDAAGRTHFGDKADSGTKARVVEVRVNSYDHVTYESLKRAPDASKGTGDHHVLLYGTTWCGYCRKAREYFAAHGIAYTDLDIEKDVNAKVAFDAMGGRGVPVILVGSRRMNGFSEDGFKKIYP